MTDKFVDLNGEIRLIGTLVAPGGLLPAGGTTGQVLTKASNANGDADWETGGGGYTPPTGRAWFSGNDVTITNGGIGILTWDSANIAQTILDVSVLDTPTVVVAGIYAVSADVDPGAGLTAGGTFDVNLKLDVAGDAVTVKGTSWPAVVGHDIAFVTVCCTYYIPAGGAIQLQVINRDGAASRGFGIDNVVVQRIT